MAYTPPIGSNIVCVFSEAYTIPLGSNIVCDFAVADEAGNAVFASAIVSEEWGTASLVNLLTVVEPTGMFTEAWGNPTLSRPLSIAPAGMSTNVFGTVSVQNKNRFVVPVAIDAMLMGAPIITFADRTLRPLGMSTMLMGNPLPAGGIRELGLTSRGINPGPFATPAVTFFERFIRPPWFYTNVFAAPMIGYHQPVTATGFESLLFGDTNVKDNHQEIGPPGIDGEFGVPFVDNAIRTIGGQGWYEDDIFRFGRPDLINSRQIITANYEETQWNLGGFTEDTHIYNRNLVIDLVVNGIAPPFRQIPLTHEIFNNARPIAPAGIDSLTFGQQLCAFFIRTLPLAGWDSMRIGEFVVVYNSAYEIRPLGFNASAVGTPENVVNTRRYFPFIGVGATMEIGTPFVAFAIRTLVPVPFLTDIGYFSLPSVWFYSREIAPAGFQYTPFGQPAFDVHFNILHPHAMSPDNRWGEARVFNLTPTITPTWDEDSFTKFGLTAIFNRNNYYAMQGFGDSTFGLHYIADRTRTILLSGFSALRISNLADVRNEIPDPPANQMLLPPSLSVATVFGTVTVTANSIYPEGWDNARYGGHTVKINGIFPFGITPPYDEETGMQVGKPTLNPTQFVSVESMFDAESGKPHLDPYTIWAPAGAPQQARDNHPPGSEEPIDAFLFGPAQQSSMPVWGRADVQNKNRTIVVGDGIENPIQVGVPIVRTDPQFINVEGIKSQKFGFPTLPAGVPIQPASFFFDPDAFGEPALTLIGGTFVAAPAGMLVNDFGLTWVANFHREIPVVGISSMLFGIAHPQPPPPPAEPDGQDFLVFGEGTFIDYRIRYREVQGFDSFTMEYTPGQFKDRLRVTGQIGVLPLGIDDGEMGAPTVGDYSHTLQVQGIPVGPIAVSIPAVRSQNIVALASFGIASELFGDVFYAGELDGIRPQGSDFSVFGTAHLWRYLESVTLDETLGMGAVSAAFGIGASLADTAQYGAATVMGFGCGRQARAMVGFGLELFGNAGIVYAPPPGTHGAIGWDSLGFGEALVRGRNSIAATHVIEPDKSKLIGSHTVARGGLKIGGG